MESYELDQHEIDAMKALADFVDKAFAGYPGEAGKIEEEMALHVCWVCEDFMRLLVASAEQQKEYERQHKED